MEKRWIIKKRFDNEKLKNLAESLQINQYLANLLLQRGVFEYDEAKAFFRPKLSFLHDPFLMKDMDKAVDRIDIAFSEKEKILVYGDYDVDGTTAVALMYTFLKKYYDEVDFYIPDRYEEGYGISYQGIDFAKENNFSLIIALDCGIKAVDKVEYAKSKGVDFIIADHHRPEEKLPEAAAVLDPKRDDCDYPYKELSGCGVGFKLAQAYSKKHNYPMEFLHSFLDLAVMSIAADIVPITGENRVLAYYGLQRLNEKPRYGISAILKYSKHQRKTSSKGIGIKKLKISDLVFMIGPRINAAGRIESGKNSVRLLISENMEDADILATQIDSLNTERRYLDTMATEQALEMIENDNSFKGKKTTVVYNPDWHKGVIGIVASRLTEHHYRPTIVMTLSNDLITGSARSIKNFDVYEAIDACSDLIEHFGGHKYAAGLSIKPENFQDFKEKFEQEVENRITEKMMIPEIEIDEDLSLDQINQKFYNILKQFAPFGPDNMSPIFKAENVVDTGYGRIVGKNHLKLNLVHTNISSFPISAIAFQQGHHFDYIKSGLPFDICYHIEENEWNGHKNLQLNINDIKIPQQ